MPTKKDKAEEVKKGKTRDGGEKHFSVGAIIKKKRKILVLDRLKPPFGWACPAGHINKDESPKEALAREVKEEVGLLVTELDLIFYSADVPNQCRRGAEFHDWYIFECKVKGSVSLNAAEAKNFMWCSVDELFNLNLEPVWGAWFLMLEKACLI